MVIVDVFRERNPDAYAANEFLMTCDYIQELDLDTLFFLPENYQLFL